MRNNLIAAFGVAGALAMGAAEFCAARAEPAPQKKSETVAQAAAPAVKPAAKSALASLPPGLRPASIEYGVASVYCFRNGPTASGERSRPAVLTAAHKTLPLGTMVEVTNQNNGRSIVVRINDRGPYVAGRVIDLTPAGARALKFDGLANVTVRVLNHARDLRIAAKAI